MAHSIVSGSLQSSDLDEHTEAVFPWQVRFNQLSAGPFRARIDFVQAGDLMFYREHWNRSLHVTGASPDGFVMIGVVETPRSRVVWDGELLGPTNVAIKNSSQEVDFTTADGSDHIVMLVRPERLAPHVGEEIAARLLDERHGASMDRRFTTQMIQIVDRLIATLQGFDTTNATDSDVDHIETELLNLVTDNFAARNTNPDFAGKPKRRKALLRAIELIRNHKRGIRIPELSASVGVSQRTLEYAFREAFDVSAVAFIRLSRLNDLRCELVEAEPDSTTITAAASRYGFSELGRLAGQYRQLFGESPSESLARLRTAADVRLADTYLPRDL